MCASSGLICIDHLHKYVMKRHNYYATPDMLARDFQVFLVQDAARTVYAVIMLVMGGSKSLPL